MYGEYGCVNGVVRLHDLEGDVAAAPLHGAARHAVAHLVAPACTQQRGGRIHRLLIVAGDRPVGRGRRARAGLVQSRLQRRAPMESEARAQG